MSKSYKKSPWCGDKKGKWKKRRASKVVRRYLSRHLEDLYQGAQYKKIYCSRYICDYGFLYPWEEHWTYVQAENSHAHANEPKRSKEDEYRQWYQEYKAK